MINTYIHGICITLWQIYWKPSIEILRAAADRVIDFLFSLFAKGYYSIQHPNKIVNTICPLVGLHVLKTCLVFQWRLLIIMIKLPIINNSQSSCDIHVHVNQNKFVNLFWFLWFSNFTSHMTKVIQCVNIWSWTRGIYWPSCSAGSIVYDMIWV